MLMMGMGKGWGSEPLQAHVLGKIAGELSRGGLDSQEAELARKYIKVGEDISSE